MTSTMSVQQKTPSIAIAYDRVCTEHGGAEDLLIQLHQAFPIAPLLTSVWDPKISWTKQWRVLPSVLQKIPFSYHFHRLLAPLMPLAFELHDVSQYDIVLSVSSAEAKGIVTKPHQLHICYLFTPTRYLYEFESSYATGAGWHQWPIFKQAVSLARKYLLWWDQQAIHRVDTYLTLSNVAAKKIAKTYEKSAQVVYPPVINKTTTSTTAKLSQLEKIASQMSPYCINIARLVPYKRVDLAIQACVLTKQSLLIVGEGPEKQNLISLAGTSAKVRNVDQSLTTFLEAIQTNTSQQTIFTGSITDAERTMLLTEAHCALSLSDDDFGISPIQAALHSVPLVISANAGAYELLQSCPTVQSISTFTPEVIGLTIQQVTAKNSELDTNRKRITQLEQVVQPDFFIRQMQKIVYDEWRNHMKKYDNLKKGGL